MSTAIDRVAGQAVDELGEARERRRPPARRPASAITAIQPALQPSTPAIVRPPASMRSSAAVLAGMRQMPQLHHRHRVRQALRHRSRAAIRRRRAWRCAPGSRTPRRSSIAAPWPPAGRRAAAPGRPRRSGRRARWAARSMMRCSASSASDGVSSRLPMPPAIIAGAEVTSMRVRPGVERGGHRPSACRRASRRSSIRVRSGWASRCRRSASAGRASPRPTASAT